MIPAENLVAIFQGGPGRLLGVAGSAAEGQVLLEALEAGTAGVVLRTEDPLQVGSVGTKGCRPSGGIVAQFHTPCQEAVALLAFPPVQQDPHSWCLDVACCHSAPGIHNVSAYAGSAPIPDQLGMAACC